MALPDLTLYHQSHHATFWKIADGTGPYKWDGTNMTLIQRNAYPSTPSNGHPAGYHQLANGYYIKDSDNTGPYFWNGSILQLVA